MNRKAKALVTDKDAGIKKGEWYDVVGSAFLEGEIHLVLVVWHTVPKGYAVIPLNLLKLDSELET